MVTTFSDAGIICMLLEALSAIHSGGKGKNHSMNELTLFVEQPLDSPESPKKLKNIVSSLKNKFH